MDEKNRSLEILIGRYWAQTAGIVIILIGAVLFTYYSITHNLITPTMRIAIGLTSGIKNIWNLRAPVIVFS